MADVFNWFRPGYELVNVKLKWNVQVPYPQTTDGNNEECFFTASLLSPLFSPQETPRSQWRLEMINKGTQIEIYAIHLNSAGEIDYFDEPVQVKISILNKRGKKALQKMRELTKFSSETGFYFSKRDIIESNCQQSDGSLTFNCKILTHVVKKEPTSTSADPSDFSIDCTGGLSTDLDGLFYNMQFRDVILNIHGHEFPAHKNILSARSEVFAAMFQHPMKEQSTNQIKIEDIEPEVFDQLLRFIYTGRVPLDKLETMAAGLFTAADKYLLDDLKMKCENYLVHHMSPDNCVVLLLHGDLQNPMELLKEAAKFFQRFPSQVTATARWEKMKQENLVLLYDIQQFVLFQK